MELLQAFALGTLAQSSLLLAGLFAVWVTVPTRIVGILAGFGAGAMISAIAFDLVPESQVHIEIWDTVLWMLIGVAIFMLGDRLVDKRFGVTGAGAAMGIVVGSVVDGVPESLIFGIQIGTGTTISLSFLAAVFISNIPQALAPSADLVKAGWKVGTSRPALDGDRARLRRRRGPRLPGDRVAARCLRRPGGGPRRRRSAGDADELAHAVRVRARQGVGGRRDRRRLLPRDARHRPAGPSESAR